MIYKPFFFKIKSKNHCVPQTLVDFFRGISNERLRDALFFFSLHSRSVIGPYY
jgi:hypothetical protein